MWLGHWGWGMMWFGGLFWLALILIIIWLVIRVSRDDRLRRGDGASFHQFGDSRETPLDILKRRYAKGEITKDEFERMKSDLRD